MNYSRNDDNDDYEDFSGDDKSTAADAASVHSMTTRSDQVALRSSHHDTESVASSTSIVNQSHETHATHDTYSTVDSSGAHQSASPELATQVRNLNHLLSQSTPTKILGNLADTSQLRDDDDDALAEELLDLRASQALLAAELQKARVAAPDEEAFATTQQESIQEEFSNYQKESFLPLSVLNASADKKFRKRPQQETDSPLQPQHYATPLQHFADWNDISERDDEDHSEIEQFTDEIYFESMQSPEMEQQQQSFANTSAMRKNQADEYVHDENQVTDYDTPSPETSDSAMDLLQTLVASPLQAKELYRAEDEHDESSSSNQQWVTQPQQVYRRHDDDNDDDNNNAAVASVLLALLKAKTAAAESPMRPVTPQMQDDEEPLTLQRLDDSNDAFLQQSASLQAASLLRTNDLAKAESLHSNVADIDTDAETAEVDAAASLESSSASPALTFSRQRRRQPPIQTAALKPWRSMTPAKRRERRGSSFTEGDATNTVTEQDAHPPPKVARTIAAVTPDASDNVANDEPSVDAVAARLVDNQQFDQAGERKVIKESARGLADVIPSPDAIVAPLVVNQQFDQADESLLVKGPTLWRPRSNSSSNPDSPGSQKPGPLAAMVRAPSRDSSSRSNANLTEPIIAKEVSKDMPIAISNSKLSGGSLAVGSLTPRRTDNARQLVADTPQRLVAPPSSPSSKNSPGSTVMGASLAKGSYNDRQSAWPLMSSRSLPTVYVNDAAHRASGKEPLSPPRIARIGSGSGSTPRQHDAFETKQPDRVQTTQRLTDANDQLPDVADTTGSERSDTLNTIAPAKAMTRPGLSIKIPSADVLPRRRSYNDLETSRHSLSSTTPLGADDTPDPPTLRRYSHSDQSHATDKMILDPLPSLPEQVSNLASPAMTDVSSDFDAMWDTLSMNEPKSVDMDLPPATPVDEVFTDKRTGFANSDTPATGSSRFANKGSTKAIHPILFQSKVSSHGDEAITDEESQLAAVKKAQPPRASNNSRKYCLLVLAFFIIAALIWIPVLIWSQKARSKDASNVIVAPTTAPSIIALVPTRVVPLSDGPTQVPARPSGGGRDTLLPSRTFVPSLVPTLAPSDVPSLAALSSTPSLSPTAAYSSNAPTNQPSVSPAPVAIVVPTVSPITGSPTVVIAGLFGLLASRSLDGGAALRNESSPQYEAYRWLSGNDNVNTYSEDRLLQRYSLATLYYSTDGPNWTQVDSWLSNSNECSWFVQTTTPCGPANDLTKLELYYNDLGGQLPLEIALLSNLVKIDLSGGPSRSLSGTIPPSLGALTLLKELKLQNNDLAGPLPTELGELTELIALDLSYNRLSGTIMTELGNLKRLEKLRLSANGLTGSIPVELQYNQFLLTLMLDNNMLTGGIDPFIGQLTNLQTIVLENNKLSSTLPSTVGNLLDLMVLSLADNSMSGSLPDTLGKLTNLIRLSLANNAFSGRLPNSLSYLQKLTEELDLSFNSFTGTIPLHLGDIDGNLRVLKLDHNQLSGIIPASFTKFIRLNLLNLQTNNLTGSMPTGVCSLFNQTLPSIFVDCDEVDCPCCNYCCTDGALDCQCRYEGTPKEWMCYF
ncbi:hypothetical protein MPSEU_000753400 [Mayamaea pseudoterrestris]|nr:hypothetical protein MPSEU_000753400 [Mayamaea pseudoterrestris]